MGNGKFYNCPHCSQTSTRQWNMKRHIQRYHREAQDPASKINNEPFGRSTRAFRVNPHNNPRTVSAHPKNDQTSDYWHEALEPWQEALKPLQKFGDLIESWSKLKARFSVSTNSINQQSASFPFSFPFTPPSNGHNQQPSVTPKSFSQPSVSHNTINQQPSLNPNPLSSFSQHPSVGAPSPGGTLGYKGFVCNRCLYANIYSIQASSFRGSLRISHRCSQASIQGILPSHRVGTLQESEQELIFHLKRIIDKTTRERELIELRTVGIPYHQFGPGSNSQEECVNLDPVQRPIPNYIERAALQGVAAVYKSELSGFLEIFLGTLGYFRLRIGGLPHYFFIYISNWLEPEI